MQKLKLDTLEVASFETLPTDTAEKRGTVQAHAASAASTTTSVVVPLTVQVATWYFEC